MLSSLSAVVNSPFASLRRFPPTCRCQVDPAGRTASVFLTALVESLAQLTFTFDVNSRNRTLASCALLAAQVASSPSLLTSIVQASERHLGL